jgi:hypothetical protein
MEPAVDDTTRRPTAMAVERRYGNETTVHGPARSRLLHCRNFIWCVAGNLVAVQYLPGEHLAPNHKEYFYG